LINQEWQYTFDKPILFSLISELIPRNRDGLFLCPCQVVLSAYVEGCITSYKEPNPSFPFTKGKGGNSAIQ